MCLVVSVPPWSACLPLAPLCVCPSHLLHLLHPQGTEWSHAEAWSPPPGPLLVEPHHGSPPSPHGAHPGAYVYPTMAPVHGASSPGWYTGGVQYYVMPPGSGVAHYGQPFHHHGSPHSPSRRAHGVKDASVAVAGSPRGGKSRSAAASPGSDRGKGVQMTRTKQLKQRRSRQNSYSSAEGDDEDPTNNSITTRQWLRIIRLHK